MRRLLLTSLFCMAAITANAQDCVLLLHGIARSPASLHSLQSYLQNNGYNAESLTYPDRTKDLFAIAEDLHPTISAYAANCHGQLHFVTHSMGGLVARGYIQKYRPANLGRVVMLAPPNQGSELADALQNNPAYRSFFGPAGQQLTTSQSTALTAFLGTPNYPTGIIAGTSSINPPASYILPGADDGAVTVSRTLIPGLPATPANFLALPVNHTTMMNNPAVHSATLRFLQSGHF